MQVVKLTQTDASRAEEYWVEYQKAHDVSEHLGKTAGIDPFSGNVRFGETASDIVRQMENEGSFAPLYYIRVGSDYYCRKGKHSAYRRRERT